jgi:hypothetical protein
MELQCAFMLKAYGAAAGALQRKDRDAFWYAVQALLDAAGHIHDFLVTDPGLRSALGVADDSALLRPELEEAGDAAGAWSKWASSQGRAPLRLTNFGPLGVSDADPAVFARFIDVNRSVCIVFGRTYDIARLMAEAAGLNQRVKEELRRMRELV